MDYKDKGKGNGKGKAAKRKAQTSPKPSKEPKYIKHAVGDAEAKSAFELAMHIKTQMTLLDTLTYTGAATNIMAVIFKADPVALQLFEKYQTLPEGTPEHQAAKTAFFASDAGRVYQSVSLQADFMFHP